MTGNGTAGRNYRLWKRKGSLYSGSVWWGAEQRENPLQADLSVPGAVGKIVEGGDLVVGAVPGFMDSHTLRDVIYELQTY